MVFFKYFDKPNITKLEDVFLKIQSKYPHKSKLQEGATWNLKLQWMQSLHSELSNYQAWGIYLMGEKKKTATWGCIYYIVKEVLEFKIF